MRDGGETAPTADTLSCPLDIHQPVCQAVSLAVGLGDMVTIRSSQMRPFKDRSA